MNALKKRKVTRPSGWNADGLVQAAIAAAPFSGELQVAHASWKVGIKTDLRSPSEFDRASDYLLYAQAGALFLKRPSNGDKRKLVGKTIDSLLRDEARNRITTRRLTHYNRYPDRQPELIRVVLSRARGLIRDILGEVGTGTLDLMYELARPGSGSSVGTRKSEWTSPEHKYSEFTRLCVTPGAFPYVQRLLAGHWGERMAGVPVEICAGNKVSVVDKNAFTMRTIAIEPSLNVHLQIGAGELIARRLRHAGGPDIRDQTRNGRLAEFGARHWRTCDPLCTVDLASASNSITRALVRQLLPSCWAGLLEDLRSEYGVLPDGSSIEYSMISSMGNGFTFPLQTLIFWSLSVVVSDICGYGREDVATYGDDIIVRRGCVLLLKEVLRFAGLRFNTDKSFVFGPFRESCGEDWFDQTRVTPCYIRGVLDEATYYRVCNTYPKRCSDSDIRGELRRIGKEHAYILRGPYCDDASGHLWSVRYPRKWVNDWQCYSYKTLAYRPLTGRGSEDGQYCAWLASRTRKGHAPMSPTTCRGVSDWGNIQSDPSPPGIWVVRRCAETGVRKRVCIDRDKASQRRRGVYRVVTVIAPA